MPKISALPTLTTPDGADQLPVNDVSASTTKKITLTALKDWMQSAFNTVFVNSTGWVSANETWLFVSVDNPTGIIRVAADVTAKYSAGMRIKFTNGGNTIYGIITVVGTFSGGYTNITFLHEINPSTSLAKNIMANSAITSNSFSGVKVPYLFPQSPDSWTIYKKYTTDFSNVPSGTTIYNAGGAVLEIPIGLWRTKYKVLAQVGVGGASLGAKFMTVSLATTASSIILDNAISLAGASIEFTRLYAEKTLPIINLTSKANYYLNYRNDSGSGHTIYILGSGSTTVIEALCAYY